MRSKTEERRELILEMAAQTFKEVGYEKTSMNEITARVGGSKATLYNYFASKEELFVAVMLRGAGQLRVAFESLHASDDLAATLRAFGRVFLHEILSPGMVATLRMIQNEAGSEAGRVFHEAGPAQGQALLTGFFKDAIANGQVRQADPRVVAQHLTALLESEFLSRRMMGVMDQPTRRQTDAAADRAIDVFMAAYGR
jgi:AcrR family transcriptional regulator